MAGIPASAGPGRRLLEDGVRPTALKLRRQRFDVRHRAAAGIITFQKSARLDLRATVGGVDEFNTIEAQGSAQELYRWRMVRPARLPRAWWFIAQPANSVPGGLLPLTRCGYGAEEHRRSDEAAR